MVGPLYIRDMSTSKDLQPTSSLARGPLAGLRVIEFAGLGPAPFACMLLSDMGAQVIRIDRPDAHLGDSLDIIGRGRQTVLLDLKQPAAASEIIDLLAQADVLVEGFRPGVMERLGLGPEEVARCNPRLIYARMTGWGQEGPLASAAGHDINYISIAGALAAIGPRAGSPVPPLNLVGDYGGGSLYLIVGILAYQRARTGGGRGHLRWRRFSHESVPVVIASRKIPGSAGHQHARWRRALLRRL